MRTAKPISSPLAGRAAMPTGSFLEIAMRLSGQRNQCPSCGEPFNSNAAFDKHRTGQFGKDRRCMSVDEMLAHGMAKNAAGWWVTALNPMFAEEVTE